MNCVPFSPALPYLYIHITKVYGVIRRPPPPSFGGAREQWCPGCPFRPALITSDSLGTRLAPSKISANFPSSSAASNSPLSGCPRLFLSVLSYPAILHTYFRRKCFASSTSCPLHSLHFLSSLPSPLHLPVSMRSCAVPPLSLVTILRTTFDH